MEAEEQFALTDRARLYQWFPWLHLFRAFRIAWGVWPLLLGITAVLLIDAGQHAIGLLPFSAGRTAGDGEWSRAFDELSRESEIVDFERFAARPFNSLSTYADRGAQIVRPLWTLVNPGRVLFTRGNSWADVAEAWSHLLWALIVWGVFGVALARVAALRFAVDTRIGVREALSFSLKKLVSALGAPLLPLVGVFVLWMLCLAGGLIGRLPEVGPVLVGLFWGAALLLGGLMTLILLVVAAGWPLMLSSIGTEDADAFDAFSRVYSYLFSRPWYALWLAIVALLYGSLLLTFVLTVLSILMPVAEWAVASGMGEQRMQELLAGGENAAGFATSAVRFWERVVGLLVVGFVVSYFWTAVTILYFLLRKSVDAMPLDAVAQTQNAAANDSSSLPLVGVAAAQQREQTDSGEPGA